MFVFVVIFVMLMFDVMGVGLILFILLSLLCELDYMGDIVFEFGLFIVVYVVM